MNPKIPAIKPAVFILVCTFIAGVYGSVSLERPTAFVLQSLPAIIALPLLWLGNRMKGGELSQQN